MKINIGIIGLGTVGRGFCEILRERQTHQDLEARIIAVSDRSCGTIFNSQGLDLNMLIKHSQQKQAFRAEKYPGSLYDLIRKEAVDIWIEMTNTNLDTGLPATDYIRYALSQRKHVISTNKGPASLFYKELKALAKENGVQFLIEGTVLAGTPVINLLEGPLAGCKVSKIAGILNGTSNFILSEMDKGLPFDDALHRAQSLGFAEADPSGDINGSDARAKIRILSNLLLFQELCNDSIYCQGIEDLSSKDINAARQQGKCWKLLGTIEVLKGTARASVEPVLLDKSHPLAGVNGNMNALTFTTDLLGEVTIIGPGAGKQETAFAVLNELLQINSTTLRGLKTLVGW